ncbi:polysaccharide deacetylase family protein [Bradyrhizobium sp. Arg62]|uniref:polysaccharide deacetylase family protein n=1 Tax=Bradyrhizobium brasilense TaxID=1419277 RepID=UPI001E4666AA|nr:polysaccharide deacetylase family protein [Bradyrhizobium brasilense]MCC8944211.1 polysaccharide deacetylase family protein [Bradyrhizobium brasilense]
MKVTTMPTNPKRGMDHDLYTFTPITARETFRARGSKVLYIYILLYLEYWALSHDANAHPDPRFAVEYGSYFPEFRTWSYREYGNRVGIYRILKLFDQAKIRPAVPVNASALRAHPELVDQVKRRGLEIIAHGVSADRMITSRMEIEEERNEILKSRDLLTAAFGYQPRGWLGQDFGGTERTSAILAEAGFTYTLDWANDELPYRQSGSNGLYAVPAFPDFDDVEALWLRRLPLQRFTDLIFEAVTRLEDEEAWGRIIGLGVHPWVFGGSHRIKYLNAILTFLKEKQNVEIVTPGDIVDRLAGQAIESE